MDSEHHYYNRRKEDTRERILEPHVVTIHKTETGFGFNVRGQVRRESCVYVYPEDSSLFPVEGERGRQPEVNQRRTVRASPAHLGRASWRRSGGGRGIQGGQDP